MRAYDARVQWDPARRAEPRLLGLQFAVCVGAWTVIDLLFAGAISTSGILAAVGTGVVLVAVSWTLVKLGWDHGPSRGAP
jgi:hypothetical protein